MRMKKLIFAAAIAALALVSCQKTAQVVGERQAVKFSVENIATYTVKANPIDDATPGQVGIFAADLSASNVAATISGTSLTPASTIYWLAGQQNPSTFVAYYPYVASREVTSTEFIPPYNQDAVDFTLYDNFLTAVKSASPSDANVSFQFTHPFAKMRLNIDNQLGADVITYIEITGIKEATAINIETGDITLPDETRSHYPAAITANSVYELVIAPQSASPTVIVHTSQGSVYTFVISAAYNFQAGKVGVASLTLSNSSSETAGLQAAQFAIDVEEAEWEDGTAATFNDPTATVSNNYWYLIGSINGSNWDVDYPMVLQSDGAWKITLNYLAGQEFKIRQGKAWTNNYGNNGTAVIPLGEDYAPAQGGEGNNLQFAATGVYDIYFHPSVPKIYAANHQ